MQTERPPEVALYPPDKVGFCFAQAVYAGTHLTFNVVLMMDFRKW